MNTSELRIIKNGTIFEIQAPKKNWLGKYTGQWETLGNPDWAAVYGSLEEAKKQIAHWNGEDANACNVVFP